ncbi:hypothetical protein ACFYWU_37610 [Streptomyces chrestomyceticus]|uniref:hypothetical protein n=1 Tax=Streptomyces chrestomyceticus TaxID=68185 RepID=UPI0036B8FA2D
MNVVTAGSGQVCGRLMWNCGPCWGGRPPQEVWDYERYAGHRAWEGARGTVGRSYDFWARHRYPRCRLFPPLHVVLAGLPEHLLQRRLQALGRDVEGITVAVLATTLLCLQRGEPWYELAVDDCPPRRRARYPFAGNR